MGCLDVDGRVDWIQHDQGRARPSGGLLWSGIVASESVKRGKWPSYPATIGFLRTLLCGVSYHSLNSNKLVVRE